jgi:hypothetical protein
LSADCQQITYCDRQNTLSTDRFGWLQTVLMRWIRQKRRQPRGRGPAPPARLDRRGRQRPIRRGGRGCQGPVSVGLQPSSRPTASASGFPRRGVDGPAGLLPSRQVDHVEAADDRGEHHGHCGELGRPGCGVGTRDAEDDHVDQDDDAVDRRILARLGPAAPRPRRSAHRHRQPDDLGGLDDGVDRANAMLAAPSNSEGAGEHDRILRDPGARDDRSVAASRDQPVGPVQLRPSTRQRRTYPGVEFRLLGLVRS